MRYVKGGFRVTLMSGLVLATILACAYTYSRQPSAPSRQSLQRRSVELGIAPYEQGFSLSNLIPVSTSTSRTDDEEQPGGLPGEKPALPEDGLRPEAGTHYRSPGIWHKIVLRDSNLSATLLASGARTLADYGGFQLMEMAEGQIEPSLLAQSPIEFRDDYNLILLHAKVLDTTTPEVIALRGRVEPFEGKRLHLVQFIGPIQPGWYDELAGTGVQIVTYIPNNAYLVYGDWGALTRLQEMAARLPAIQWEGAYLDAYRVHPAVTTSQTDLYAIQMVDDPQANFTSDQLFSQVALERLSEDHSLGYYNVVLRLLKGAIYRIAQRPDVISIMSYVLPELADERQDQIIAGNLTGNAPTGPGYLAWLASKGFTQAQFTASGFAVDVSDSGIDNATTSPTHFGLYVNGVRPGVSRVIYNRLEGTPNGGSTLRGCDGHGTIDAHIVAGYNNLTGFPHTDSLGFHFGLGVCPFVKVGSSVIFDPSRFTSPDYEDLQSRAYRDGARLSTNSWGAGVSGAYNADAQRYDALVRDAQPNGSAVPNAGNQEMVIVFAAHNFGPSPQSVGSPGTAKNVITVGASENVHPFGGSDRCGFGDTAANSANDLATFSGRGPCADGRKKPDIVAPGVHITGGVFQVNSPPVNGQADPCFTGSQVCGGVGSNFFPAGQQWYTSSTGTSHATPAVAGGAALVRQYFINQNQPAPSPAMTKAFLMNSASHMNGAGANDTLWSNNQGMGRMNLGMAFDGTPRILRDQFQVDMFTATGQTRVFTGTISDMSKPFRVTLAWTDAPGSTSGAAWKNDLDLTVTVGGQTYKGNVFSGANSTPGGTADPRNNVESVFLPAGVSGSFVIQITAANINSDGVPNVGGALDQDFALSVYNGTTVATPVIASRGSTLTAESCAPGNQAIDPGEWVTVEFAFQNVGSANTSNVVATLQASGGVTPITTSQSYGVLIANGPTVSRPFTFRASGTCGDTIIAILHLQDETRDLGSFQFVFRLGTLGTPVTVNYSSGALNIAIPDLGRAEHTIVVPDTGSVSDVNVRVRLNHTYDGDLILSLIHPDGTEVILSNRRGGSGDNFGSGSNDCNGTFTVFDDSATTPIGSGSAPFAGRFRPDQSLSALNGKPSNGNWTLRITDNAAIDIGTLFCWQLEVTRQSPVCCVSAPPGDVNGDGCVNNADLRAVLAEFGGPESGSHGNTDLDNNGIVGDEDLAEVLSNFGNGC